MKKALSVILSLLLVLSVVSAMPFSAFALDARGPCGDNVIWSFDRASGALTLSGMGDTWDYTYDKQSNPTCASPFFENKDIKTITVESGITGIGDYLFVMCYKAESVSLPDGLKRIGEEAFGQNHKVESLTIPDSVTSIEKGAFNNWRSLKSITIPEGVTTIEPYTFMGCSELHTVFIPATVTSVGLYAFAGCSALTDVYFTGSQTDKNNMTVGDSNTKFTNATWYYESGFCGDNVYYGFTYGANLGEEYKNLFINGTGDMYAWDNADNKSPFNGDQFIETVTIGQEVTNVGAYAFTGCTELIWTAIPKSVTAIGEGAFTSTSVREFAIPYGVETVEQNTFSGCDRLEQLYIPSSVTAVKSGAFQDAPLTDGVFCGARSADWNGVSIAGTGNETLAAADKYFDIPAFDTFGGALVVEAQDISENSDETILVIADGNRVDEGLAVIVSDAHAEIMRNEGLLFSRYMSNRNFSLADWTLNNLARGEYSVFAYSVFTTATGNKELYYGSGTFKVSPDPNRYTISNYAELKDFADAVESGGTTINAVLTADIVCKNDPGDADYAADWTPIGNSAQRYTGTFDGDGHTITGLTTPANCGNYAGLFGCVGTGGVVQNVKLKDCSITGDNSVGGIVGRLDGGTIQNCANASAVTGNDSVGGIVGWLNGGTIQNCANASAVTGNDPVGGIAGYVIAESGTPAEIRNCRNTGAVTAARDYGNGGGIVGHAYATSGNAVIIANCSNTGAVSGPTCGGAAGGIAGNCSVNGIAEITSCYNTGAVTITSYGGNQVEAGGIVGTISSSGGTTTVENCYNTAAVTATGNENNWVGGIVGLNERYGGVVTIDGCYNAGEITGTHIGGILGRNHAIGGTGFVENCCYDSSVSNTENAIYETPDDATINVKGLATAQMTGENALSAMTGFADTDWLTKADSADESGETYYWYYPHLKGFNLDGSGAQLAADAIGAADWPAKVEVAVTWSGKESYTYDAADQKPVVSSVTVGGSELTADVDYTVSYKAKSGDSWNDCSKCINAGDYRAVVAFGDGQHEFVKDFTINKAPLKITAKDLETTYNGLDQGYGDTVYDDAREIAQVITVEGLKGTDEITSVILDGHEKEVGDHIIVPSNAKINDVTQNSNYDITYVNGRLKIRLKTIQITVNGNSTAKTYNGTQQSFNGTFTAVCPDEGFDASCFSYTGSTTVSGTDADEYTLSPVTTGCDYSDDNYAVNWIMGTPVKLTINPAAVTITADNKETNHGDDLDTLTYQITGDYYGDNLGITLSTDADNKKPGTYDITVSYTPDGNYNVTTRNGKYVVGDDPHTWGDVTYEWTGTSSVKASHVCVYCDEEETETVNTTANQTKDPTCTEKGETTYTATFTNAAFETQVKTVDDVKENGHTWKTAWSQDADNHWHDCENCDEIADNAAHVWSDVTYEWTDTTTVKATRTCTVCNLEETETVDTTAEQTADPTCTENGETTYTAAFANPAFETRTKTEADVDALGHDMTHHPRVEPTATEEGNIEYWECGTCGKLFADENGTTEISADDTVLPALPVYAFTGDSDAEWTKGSDKPLAFTAKRSLDDDETFERFLGAEVDGKEVDARNYDATKGSVNLELKADYLETLSVGKHRLKLLFIDGDVETTFTVKEAETTKPAEPTAKPAEPTAKPAGGPGAPDTGDALNVPLFTLVFLFSVTVFCFTRKKRRDEAGSNA